MGIRWAEQLIVGLKTLNDILTAGIAITAFSLLLYAFSFNLKDRVARSFAVVLLALAVVFTSETLASATQLTVVIDLAYRLQWVGLVFLPPAYLHLSDALLITVGRPSRGRRRMAVRGAYVISAGFLVLLVSGHLVGPLLPEAQPVPHHQRTFWTTIFTLYYVFILGVAIVNFLRAYRRTLTRSGRRRMIYLMSGATAPAVGAFPYLLYGSQIAAAHPLVFWLAVVIVNFLVGGLVVVMAYAVAFFGVAWPDRVVKTRLFKWILRGPVTASLALGAMIVVRRIGAAYGQVYTAAVPFSVVLVILVMEYAITLLGPALERRFFMGPGREQLLLLQQLEVRLLTQGDLRQFLDVVLAAVRDTIQSPFAFVAALEQNNLPGLIVTSGAQQYFASFDLAGALERVAGDVVRSREYLWRDYLVLPLYAQGGQDQEPLLLGILGCYTRGAWQIDEAQRDALWLLAGRAALALEDRLLQKQIFQALEDIQPQAEYLQKMRADGRYAPPPDWLQDDARVMALVKDAFAHYWGGPKLTDNPLLELEVVQQMAAEYDGNRANALRALLRRGLETVRPQGERRFTTEWILYNILELKFLQGQKVRDVAARLALSEADLYRKQRVAIAEVARAIIKMEREIRKQKAGKE